MSDLRNQTAYPVSVAVGPSDDFLTSRDLIGGAGMTYRQWLIGQALAGYRAKAEFYPVPSVAASYAIQAADAVLDALAEEKEGE